MLGLTQMAGPRIVSLIASATEIVCALGHEKLDGRTISRMRFSVVNQVPSILHEPEI